MRYSTLGSLREQLVPGKVYRRAELSRWSRCVDRHLQLLVKEGTLRKVRYGMYYCPTKSVFGEVPAAAEELVHAFLKNNDFLLTSPNTYNALGVGLTQLHNTTVVYNHKRTGVYKLGWQVFEFKEARFPRKVNEAFILVDLVNNVTSVGEDSAELLERVRKKATTMNRRKLRKAVFEYASMSSRKFFESALNG